MKILIIDESINRIGGVERIISVLSNNLAKENSVDVVSEYKSSSEPFYKYSNNVSLKYLLDSRKFVTNNMKDKSLKYYFYRIIEKTLVYFSLNKKIKKIIRVFNDYDVIIFGRVFSALDFLRKIGKEKVNSKIIVRDAIHLRYYNNKIQKEIKELFPRFVDTFIVSSEESIETYKNFFGNEKIDLKKIYNPLGIEPINGYSFSNKTVISIGRLDDQKGFENLIRAFSVVRNNHPDWKLQIYGSGLYEKYLNSVISENDLEECVTICPPTKDVVSVFNNSSIFVLPSRYEGYANILVEALSCGMPSISFNWLMGAEEIIQNGKNGIIIPLSDREKYFNGIDSEEDAINLANTINYLIENKKICDTFSKNAIKIVKSRKIDYIIEKWLDIINL